MKRIKTDMEIFLVAGFVGDYPVISENDPSDDNIVLAYIVASNPNEAISAQEKALPNFKATGIVSLHELRKHFMSLERLAISKKTSDSTTFMVGGFVGENPEPDGSNHVVCYATGKNSQEAVQKITSEKSGFKPTGSVPFSEVRKHLGELERISRDEEPYYDVPRA